ncbi:MAG: methylated-DNA--[protein]-cysteine S-methyltransferase, partial [Bacteroidota bacterium]
MLAKAYYQSPLGIIEIQGSENGIASVKLKTEPSHPSEEIPASLQVSVQQLDEYFRRKRKVFDLKLDFGSATDFYQKVWNALLEIPYGQSRSYAYIAEKIGSPKAVRAVGLANRNNPIAFIIPCHRVIGKSGNLQGYFYGLNTKRKLLQLENPMSFAEQGRLFN